jgi:glycosyltransferase involved in cell wall biosynthesis
VAESSEDRRVLVVLPALNESAAIANVIRQVRRAEPTFDVLVVDDGSTDDTAHEALRAGAKVCTLPFNLGVGGAMRTAYKYAQREGYDVVVQVDADGQHDPRFVRQLVAALDSVDMVIGSRFSGTGYYSAPLLRRLAMRLLAAAISLLSRKRFSDVTSGFRAVGPRCIDLFAVHYPAEYLGDTVESLVIALRTGCRVSQVPVPMHQRAGGAPSQSVLRAGLFLARAVAALLLALVRQWPVPTDIRQASLAPSRNS